MVKFAWCRLNVQQKTGISNCHFSNYIPGSGHVYLSPSEANAQTAANLGETHSYTTIT